MNNSQRIKNYFTESISLQIQCAEELPDRISQASKQLVACLLTENKIMACGNGSSAADAQDFTTKLINRFQTERPSLPGLALTTDLNAITAIANDYHFNQIFSKQLSALGKSNDILVVLSSSGNSLNLIEAIRVAHAKKITVIALTGNDGGDVRKSLNAQDTHICIPSDTAEHVQEVHRLVLHCFCDLIDNKIFGQGD
jgi:D-sedoheptulose 7-phosphate isomerase